MKTKPAPKRELLAIQEGRHIKIHIASTDAKTFILTECAQFGSLLEMDGKEYLLIPGALYDIAEITDWINSYND